MRDLDHVDGVGSRGGEFEREGDPVEAPTDFRDRWSGDWCELESGVRRPRPLGKQRDGRNLGELVDAEVGESTDVERIDDVHPLTGDGERFATRRDHEHVRRCSKDLLHQGRDRLDQVLTVVHDEQHVFGAQEDDDRHVDRRVLPEAYVEGGRDCAECLVAIADTDEFDEGDSVTPTAAHPTGQLEADRGLSHPGRADDRQQTRFGQLVRELVEEVVAPDQRVDRQGQRKAKFRSGRGDRGGRRCLALGWFDGTDRGDELVALAVHGADDSLTRPVVTDGTSRGLHS